MRFLLHLDVTGKGCNIEDKLSSVPLRQFLVVFVDLG